MNIRNVSAQVLALSFAALATPVLHGPEAKALAASVRDFLESGCSSQSLPLNVQTGAYADGQSKCLQEKPESEAIRVADSARTQVATCDVIVVEGGMERENECVQNFPPQAAVTDVSPSKKDVCDSVVETGEGSWLQICPSAVDSIPDHGVLHFTGFRADDNQFAPVFECIVKEDCEF